MFAKNIYLKDSPFMNASHLLFLITLLFLQVTTAFAQPLVGRFRLNNNFTDDSKIAINGTSNLATAPKGVQDRVGNNNSAFLFDGIDDYIDATANTRSITNTVTVNAWVKTSSTKLRQFVVAKYDFQSERGFHLVLIGAGDATYKEGTAFFGGRDGSGSYFSTASTRTNLNDGKWHHLCGIVDKSTWQLWVDGKLESETKSTATSPDLTTSSSLYIGDLPTVNGGSFDGIIDEVEIYNTVVKPTDVSTPCRPVGLFTLNNNFEDASALKINGSSTTSTSPVSGAGIKGEANTAFRFDGQDDYITFGTDNRGVTNHITVSAWVKTNSHKFRQFVVGKYDYNSRAGFTLTIIGEKDPNFADGAAIFGGRDGHDTYVAATSKRANLNDGKWHHVCGVLENLKWQIWVDGVLEGEATSTAASPNISVSSLLYVGNLLGNDPTINGAFDGTIDNVEVYNCAYTPERIVNELSGIVNTPTISFPAIPAKTYGDAPFTLNATASNSAAIIYTSDKPELASVSGNTVTIKAPGIVTITARAENPAASATSVLTINKKPQTITLTAISDRNQGDPVFQLAPTSSSGLTSFSYSLTSGPATVSTTGSVTPSSTASGTVTIKIIQGGNELYLPAEKSVTFNVNTVEAKITFPTISSKTFGDPTFQLNATSNKGSSINYTSSAPTIVTINGNTATILGAGSVTITASTSNPPSSASQTITIGKKSQSISVSSIGDKNQGGPAFQLAPTATSGLNIFTYSVSGPATVSTSGEVTPSPTAGGIATIKIT
ncbi:MAG TPA: LamG-like jellyroll fold domain-containing protein, partial [Cytophagaceae bacterium]